MVLIFDFFVFQSFELRSPEIRLPENGTGRQANKASCAKAACGITPGNEHEARPFPSCIKTLIVRMLNLSLIVLVSLGERYYGTHKQLKIN